MCLIDLQLDPTWTWPNLCGVPAECISYYTVSTMCMSTISWRIRLDLDL
jgi:hypothetical protein